MKIRRFIFRCLNACIAAFFLLCIISQSMASDVPLVWNPSTSTNISGYRLYLGNAPGTYDAFITLGIRTSYTVTDLEDGTWYFAVTAIDSNGNESDFSNEISQIINSSGSSNPICDFNGDESVDALDAQAMANVILGASPTFESHDLNSDGEVDVLDLQILNNVILGIRSCP